LATTGFLGPRKILADGSGAYVSGYFGGSVDFDGGTEGANRTSAGIDAFAAHYNANGGLDWAKGIGSPGFAVSIAAALTEDGYYLGGLFGNTVNFDPYNGSADRTSNSGSGDLFVARYRLTKQLKKDQKNEISNAITKEDQKTLILFPNPTDEILGIDWSGFESDESVEVRIMDLLGRPVMTRTMSTDETAIDVTGLSPGYHLFQARQNDITQVQRFMKK